MKPTLFCQQYVTGSFFHAVELEFMERILDSGGEVEVLACLKPDFGCDINPAKAELQCWLCQHQFRRGMSAMGGRIQSVRSYGDVLTAEDEHLIQTMVSKLPDSIEKLKEVTFEDFDWGMGVCSSLITRYRDHHLDLARCHDDLVNIASCSLQTYLAVDRMLQQRAFESVFVFNARYAMSRAVRRAAEKHGTPCRIHDTGAKAGTYTIYNNATVHTISVREDEIRTLWANATDDRESIGRKFYAARLDGNDMGLGTTVMKSFTTSQQRETLPASWDEGVRNIALFCSSDDEFAAIGKEWQNPIYDHQLDGIQRIARAVDSLDGSPAKLYIRMHPNLSGLDNQFIRAVVALSGDNVEVIAPESDVDSYALMSHVDKVITFGSTIGIEAAYWGKPSILVGRCLYENLGATWNPRTHEEVVEMMSGNLDGMPEIGAIMYGYATLTRGEQLKNASYGSAIQDVRYRGVHLNGNLAVRTLAGWYRRIKGNTWDRTWRKTTKNLL
ncbi:MAG: hypothetical protein KDN22_26805 [Verrucomicrobiae bacterium]|nr:hypothetical protein [Verrucomicrobiae bacterium]